MVDWILNIPTPLIPMYMFIGVFIFGGAGIWLTESISQIKEVRNEPKPPEGHTSA